MRMMRGECPFRCKAYEERKAIEERAQVRARNKARRAKEEQERLALVEQQQNDPNHVRSRLRSARVPKPTPKPAPARVEAPPGAHLPATPTFFSDYPKSDVRAWSAGGGGAAARKYL